MSETNAETKPLQPSEPLGAFSDRATDYVKYRPSYPSAAINTILKGLGEPSQLTAADVGAGTGIASRLLAERGIRVIAIEPNAEMRRAALPHPLVDLCEATAEATHLPNASIDLLTCFQAFHWFNSPPTLSEFRRILKPSGRLAIVWNDWVQNDEVLADFGRIVRKAMSNNRPSGKHHGAVKPLLSNPNFVRVRHHSFKHKHELDLFGLIGYAQSKAFVPRVGPAQQQLVSDLKELHAYWADERGLVSMTYRTNVYLAEPQLDCKLSQPSPNWLFTRWRRLNQAASNFLSQR